LCKKLSISVLLLQGILAATFEPCFFSETLALIKSLTYFSGHELIWMDYTWLFSCVV